MSCGTQNVKLEPMSVMIGTDQAQVQNIVCLGSSASANLNNKYFMLYAADGSKYYVWFNVNTGGTDPALSGYTAIPVALGANPSSATVVAAAVQSAIDANADFTATVSGYTVTVTDVTNGYAIPAHDAQASASKTNFAFNMVTVGDLYEDVGLIDGDIEVSNFGATFVDVTTHQSGADIMSQIKSGSGNPEMSFALKEVSYAKYEKLMRYTGAAYLPVGGSNTLIGAGKYGKFQVLQTAKVVLHPVRLATADKTNDYCFWKCKIGLDSVTFSGENILTLPVTVQAFQDCDKPDAISIWCYGDWSQSLT